MSQRLFGLPLKLRMTLRPRPTRRCLMPPQRHLPRWRQRPRNKQGQEIGGKGKQLKVRNGIVTKKVKWVVELGWDNRKSGVQICWVLKFSLLSYMDPRAVGLFFFAVWFNWNSSFFKPRVLVLFFPSFLFLPPGFKWLGVRRTGLLRLWYGLFLVVREFLCCRIDTDSGVLPQVSDGFGVSDIDGIRWVYHESIHRPSVTSRYYCDGLTSVAPLYIISYGFGRVILFT